QGGASQFFTHHLRSRGNIVFKVSPVVISLHLSSSNWSITKPEVGTFSIYRLPSMFTRDVNAWLCPTIITLFKSSPKAFITRITFCPLKSYNSCLVSKLLSETSKASLKNFAVDKARTASLLIILCGG